MATDVKAACSFAQVGRILSAMTDTVSRLNAALEGRYAIESELGEGGMATVYLADDLKHERKVAPKVLKPELAAVVGAERFLAEIKTTANLQHPHILPLFDSGEADTFLFYVMPFVEGETLQDRIDREKQLPVDEAVRIATAVANALQTAHDQGIIHRDIKPANILLSRGEPLIADFGIALAVGAAGGGRLTETGLSLGTPYYMSPEQATGDQSVGSSTDTYALGSVLYEMLVGDPPYAGSTAQAVLGKIIAGEPVSATKHRPSVPAHVDAALRRALEKLPADRFSSAQDFVRALGDEHFRYGELVAGVAGDFVPSMWKRLTMAFAALAAVTTLGFAWALLRPDPPQPVSRQVLSTEGWAGLGVPLGQYAAIAPDGSSMILPIGSSASDVQLALKMRGSTEIARIPGTDGGRNVVYSPNGQWIAYAMGSDLFKRPLVGGSPVRLAQDAVGLNEAGLAWLDDGTILYRQQPGTAAERGLAPTRLVQIPEDGGEALVVFWPEAATGSAVWVHGLPDARGALVGTCVTLFCPVAELHVVDLRDMSSEPILEQVNRAWYTPTGHLVYVQNDGALFAAPFDLGALAITGNAIPLFDGVRVIRGRADIQLAVDGGTILYAEGSTVGGEMAQLLVVDFDGNEEPLDLSPRHIGSVGWSPDGESVAYSSEGQIYTYNLELGTTPRQLTFEGENILPVFSPDGTRIAFASTREGTTGADLFVKDLDDDSQPRSIITLDANQWPTQWPSDTLIVFEQRPNSSELWMVNLSDPDSARAAAYLSAEARLRKIVVSPDGTLAAYASNESGQSEIYIRSFPDPGERTLVSQTAAFVPFWSPDGNTLYYETFRAGVSPFMAARIQRNPVPVVLSRDALFTMPSLVQPFAGSGLHPDGDRFILAKHVSTADADEGAAEPERLIMITNWFEELRQRVPN